MDQDKEIAIKSSDVRRRGGTKRNLLIISLAYTCAFTSFDAVTNLQSSLNSSDDVGLHSLVVFYGVSILACLFFTTPLMHIFGYKWSIFGGQIGMIGYIAASMYPKQWLLLPMSAISGILHASMSTAHDSYITLLAVDKSDNDEVDEKVTKYYSIFLIAYQSTQIWGNLVSYFILRKTSSAVNTNLTVCGANFMPNNHQVIDEIVHVSNKTIYILFGVLIGIILLSMILVIAFLSQRRDMEKDQSKSLFHKSLNYTLSTLKDIITPNHLLLIPLGFWTVAPEAFIIGAFTNV
ncbi:unnamed protein product [Adineta steineri]|uniref:UNC93-like protein n=1 Tax=Adineta steineri TaxID=433720 RepID=A0A819E5N9_9BILA|nr:unnamed protein product [Adineta steineri]CAF3844575.1 unnamed protein product [Adineta steineri]